MIVLVEVVLRFVGDVDVGGCRCKVIVVDVVIDKTMVMILIMLVWMFLRLFCW